MRTISNKVYRSWAVIDRDGVIIKDKSYVFKIEDLEFMPGAIDGLKKISKFELGLIVITNQAGVARGYYSIDDVNRFNKELIRLLKKEKIIIEKMYFCLHHPDFSGECECRKPKTGLIKQASEEFGLIPGRSFFIGDKDSDTELGINCGGKTILIANNQYSTKVKPDFKAKNLNEAADIIGRFQRD